jgi:hypothetical protein
MDMETTKKKILAVYERCYGNVQVVCDMLQIRRQTFYNYKNNDPEFKQAIEALDPDERRMDFIEDKLIQKATEGDTAVLIFLAKTKCKKRGYVEKTELNQSGGVTVKVEYGDGAEG